MRYFSLYLRAISKNKPPGGGGGAYIRRGDLTEGFLRYDFGGLIFGGAYTWRGLFSEFYGIRFCLTLKNFTALLRSGLSDERFYGSGTISYKIDLIINMTL